MERISTKGKLIIIGGNEDKVGNKKVLRHVAAASQATSICIIPTASTYGRELGDEYAKIFQGMNIPKTHVVAPRYVGDADTPEHHAMIDESDAFFFTGGDQVRLVEVFQETEAFKKIMHKHQSGALIAGTSAGAAAVSDFMLFDGDENGFKKDAVSSRTGFGFLPGITVDTHFLQRNRIPRLAQILARGVNRFAIGVDEDTAMEIDVEGNTLVIGSEIVTLMAASTALSTNYAELERNSHYFVHGIALTFLPAGARFHLPSWEMKSESAS